MLTSAVEDLERPCSPMACLNILYSASVTGLAAQAQGCQNWAQLPVAPGVQRATRAAFSTSTISVQTTQDPPHITRLELQIKISAAGYQNSVRRALSVASADTSEDEPRRAISPAHPTGLPKGWDSGARG